MHEEFSKAVMYGKLDDVQKMIAQDPSVIHSTDKWGFTALHNAMSEDPNEAIIFIIEQGANVNAQNDEGIAPLHLACSPEIADLVLKHGADKNLRDRDGRTPLHILASEGDHRYEVIQYLLEQEADASLKDNDGMTAVEISKSREDEDVVELFETWSGDLEFDFDD